MRIMKPNLRCKFTPLGFETVFKNIKKDKK